MAMEKVFTSVEHVEWLKEQARLKRPYWYGVYHLPCTEDLLQKKKRQYPEHYAEGRMPRYRQDIAAGQIAGDCVNGAIKGAVWGELGKRKPVYKSHDCPDKSADSMFSYCKSIGMDWGPIDTMPDKPGVAVRFSGHVGVYVGGGEVVEWRGFNYGCVTTKLKARKWTHWYEIPWSEYVEGEQAEPQAPAFDVGTLGARLLKKGVKGGDVRTLQEMLMGLGYELPEYGADGDFGSETETAVREFQAEHGLDADGKYGPLTHAELMQELAERSAQDDDDEEDVIVPAAPTKYVEVTGATVWIRKGPGKEHDTEGIVRRGARLEWVATAENGWHAVRADGISGWIGPKYSEVKEVQ